MPRNTGGAPKGNTNARKHGFHAKPQTISTLTKHRGAFTLASETSLSLHGTILNLRVLLDEAIDDGASIEEMKAGFDLLIRAIGAQHRLNRAEKQTLSDSMAEVLEQMASIMGVGQ